MRRIASHSLASRLRRSRLLAALLVALFTATGLAVVSATPAMAVTCSGYGCDGLDPNATGCSSGAYTVLSQNIYAGSTRVGYNELRYSPTCGTNWGRTVSLVGVTHISATVWRQGEGWWYGDMGNYSTVWSDMVYTPTPIVACAYGTVTYGGVMREPNDLICA